jgi:hypothetical protein
MRSAQMHSTPQRRHETITRTWPPENGARVSRAEAAQSHAPGRAEGVRILLILPARAHVYGSASTAFAKSLSDTSRAVVIAPVSIRGRRCAAQRRSTRLQIR